MNTNKLTFWGWGETVPSNLTNANKKLLSKFFNSFNINPDTDLFPVPSLDNILLKPPRFDINTFGTNCELLTDLEISCNKRDRMQNTYGRSTKDYIRMIMEDYSVAPDYVIYPATNKEIELILKYCSLNCIAAVTYGGGTSVVGGIETNLYGRYNGVISINLAKYMNKILYMNLIDQTITVEPGLSGMNLENYLKTHYPEYTLRHFPQSFEFASIGGMMSTRSGGHFAVGKTRIDYFLQSAKLITPDRGIIKTPEIPSSGSGIEINGAIIKGNEGIFGVVSDITLKLLKRPQFKRNIKIEFNKMSFINAAQYIREIVQCGLEPSNCRLVSGMESFSNGLSSNPKTHVAIIGFESHLKKEFNDEIHSIHNIINNMNNKYNQNAVIQFDSNLKKGKVSKNNAVGNWFYSFLSAPYARDHFQRTGILTETIETCIKWSLLPTLHGDVVDCVYNNIQKLFYKNCFYILTQRFTHIYSDGVSIYYTIIIDPRKKWKIKYNNYKNYLKELNNAWCKLKDNVTDCIVLNTGSSTHHHAVGKDHANGMVKEVGIQNIEWMISLKKHFDKSWILNPGVVIPFNSFLKSKL